MQLEHAGTGTGTGTEREAQAGGPPRLALRERAVAPNLAGEPPSNQAGTRRESWVRCDDCGLCNDCVWITAGDAAGEVRQQGQGKGGT